MNVKIINPEEVKDLFTAWSKFSATCYNSKVGTKKPYIIGMHCLKSGHFSGSRSRYIEFEITNVPRNVIDQMVRHEVGVVKNVQSFRYVSKDIGYATPVEILDDSTLLARYNKIMEDIFELYADISSYVGAKTGSKERGNEQARYILPMATYSAVTIGFTLEAFIHYCNKRLCVRTEDIHRECATMMALETIQLFIDNQELFDLIKSLLVPQCQYLGWCPEEKSCGAKPTKERLDELVKYGRAYEHIYNKLP